MVNGASVTVPPQIVLPIVEDFTELRAVDSDILQDGQPTIVVDADPVFFYWDASSLATDDGSSIIRPNDRTSLQAGRWLSGINVDAITAEAQGYATQAAASAAASATARDQALAYSNAAGLDADRAEQAADAAVLNSGLYVDTAAGLADTTNGEYFGVPSTDETYVTLYRNNSGVAAEINTYPSSQALQDALAFLQGGVDSGLEALMHHAPNRVVQNQIQLGTILSTLNGSTAPNANYFLAVGIATTPGTQYVCNRELGPASGGAWFDSAGVFISGFTAARGAAFTAPAGGVELRLSTETNPLGDPVYGPNITSYATIGVYEGAALPDFYEGGYVDATGAERLASTVARAYAPTVEDLFRPADVISGYDLGAQSAAGTMNPNALYLVTNPIRVSKTGKLFINQTFFPGNASYGWVFYNRDDVRIGAAAIASTAITATSALGSPNLTVTAITGSLPVGLPLLGTGIPAGAYVLSGPAGGGTGVYVMSANATATGTTGVSGGGTIGNVGVTVPAGTAYARITQSINNLANITITDEPLAAGNAPYYPGDAAIDTATPVIGWGDLQRMKWLMGLSIAFLGDSIMQGSAIGVNAWQAAIARFCRALAGLQVGVSGHVMRECLNYGAPTYTALVAGDFTNIDAVINNAGTNDFGTSNGAGSFLSGRPLGTLGNTSSAGTFYGDMNGIYIEKLLTWKPSMQIAMLTPLPRFDNGSTDGNPVNNLGLHLKDYADAIIAFGAFWGIPVLDLFRESGLNSKTQAGWTVDGLHPNLAFYKAVLVPKVSKWLESLR